MKRMLSLLLAALMLPMGLIAIGLYGVGVAAMSLMERLEAWRMRLEETRWRRVR